MTDLPSCQSELARVVDRTASGLVWPDEDLDALMAVMTAAPDLSPCGLVDMFLSETGAQRYSCYEVRPSIVSPPPNNMF